MTSRLSKLRRKHKRENRWDVNQNIHILQFTELIMLHCEIILPLLGLIGLAFGIPGGWRDANVNDEGVREASLFATQVLSDRANSMYHKKLTEVVKAESQVVSGIKYRVSLNMATTKCRKNEKSRNELDECDTATEHVSFFFMKNKIDFYINCCF